VSGTLAAERTEALVNYTDFRDPTQRNVRTVQNRSFSVDAWLFGGWHLLGARGSRRRRIRRGSSVGKLSGDRAAKAASSTWRVRQLRYFQFALGNRHFTDRAADP